jgi:hypothetical protein
MALLMANDFLAPERWSQPAPRPARIGIGAAGTRAPRPSRRARSSLTAMDGPSGVDVTLSARFRDRDPDAIREVYRTYGKSVYGIAYRALGNKALAE